VRHHQAAHQEKQINSKICATHNEPHKRGHVCQRLGQEEVIKMEHHDPDGSDAAQSV
jgi:hypothetical protein